MSVDSKRNELRNTCEICREELKEYCGYLLEIGQILREYREGYPLEPPKIVADGEIIIEAESPYDKGIEVLQNNVGKFDYCIAALDDYIAKSMGPMRNEDDVNGVVLGTSRLISKLSANFPSEDDIKSLTGNLMWCKRIADGFCAQRWQGGVSSIHIKTIEFLNEVYECRVVRSVENVRHLLEDYKYELQKVKYELQKVRSRVPMPTIYDSPEMAGNIPPKPAKEPEYPYFHAVSDIDNNEIQETSMAKLHTSPEEMSMAEPYVLPKDIDDNENQEAFMAYVYASPQVMSKEDVHVLPKDIDDNENQETFMAEVYASPEVMMEKKSILKRIFKRD